MIFQKTCHPVFSLKKYVVQVSSSCVVIFSKLLNALNFQSKILINFQSEFVIFNACIGRPVGHFELHIDLCLGAFLLLAMQ